MMHVIRIPVALSCVCHLIDCFELPMLLSFGCVSPRIVRHLIIISPLTMDAVMEIDVVRKGRENDI